MTPCVGLCPGGCYGDFFMPLDPGDSLKCPTCDERLIVYIRAPVAPWAG
jgi:hypothetical protein